MYKEKTFVKFSSPKSPRSSDVFARLNENCLNPKLTHKNKGQKSPKHVKRVSAPIISTSHILKSNTSLKIDTMLMKTPTHTSKQSLQLIHYKSTPQFHLNLKTGECIEIKTEKNIKNSIFNDRIKFDKNYAASPKKDRPNIFLLNDFY